MLRNTSATEFRKRDLLAQRVAARSTKRAPIREAHVPADDCVATRSVVIATISGTCFGTRMRVVNTSTSTPRRPLLARRIGIGTGIVVVAPRHVPRPVRVYGEPQRQRRSHRALNVRSVSE